MLFFSSCNVKEWPQQGDGSRRPPSSVHYKPYQCRKYPPDFGRVFGTLAGRMLLYPPRYLFSGRGVRCCCTHLDIYLLEGEFDGAFMWGVVGTAHPWRDKPWEGWGAARLCSPFPWSNHQHPWAGSTPFPPKRCKAKPCPWRVLWQQHDLQILCCHLLTEDKSPKAECDLGFDPYFWCVFEFLWSTTMLPAGFLGPNLQPLVSAFSAWNWRPCCRMKKPHFGNDFVAGKLLKIEWWQKMPWKQSE